MMDGNKILTEATREEESQSQLEHVPTGERMV